MTNPNTLEKSVINGRDAVIEKTAGGWLGYFEGEEAIKYIGDSKEEVNTELDWNSFDIEVFL